MFWQAINSAKVCGCLQHHRIVASRRARLQLGFKEVIPERGVSLPLVRAMMGKALCKVDIGAAVFQAEMVPGLWLYTQGTDEVIPFQVQNIRSKCDMMYWSDTTFDKGYYRVTEVHR